MPEAAETGADPRHGARLTIDLGAVAENWRRLGAQAPGTPCAAVVKADAYGCGLGAVAGRLWREGCRTFFVAHLEEALAARQVLPEAAIYVLNGLPPGGGRVLAQARLRPVLNAVEELAEWADLSEGRLPAALHVDTGMNRLGLRMEEAVALPGSDLPARAGIDLLMSHLVGAEVPDDAVNARQIEAFARVRAALPGLPGSLANSSGIFLGAAAHHDLLRPGYALFGGNPVPHRPNPMRPVVRLESPILQTRSVEAGERAGYNGTWTARSRRHLATLSLGYADGYPRAGGAQGRALVAGVACPIVGRISMDLVILDVTEAPGARRGALATLIGDSLDVDTVGRAAGTIGYEILTGLGSRYVRAYVE
ncbi:MULTISPECIES: alanine racemase [Methylobacterium]|uniref:Alanine racemase n=4 Tax=Pseudomonadota TaxID=1224 RepID=A0ABQ4SQZ3_9HYPH|nr:MULTISPECIES: alanine racemase [Methylobacterium]PIU06423.1 MAG: alanine racemase [Methylobacterium sp. CG09_land_8_20_14_0_10_71_15]PIU15833.1 MAG: alanine racemase [Methylobacterium sp. CG08_land_8_20_14_0_20_71_15]GBU18346.1 alanine racemase [Methylobacterium sp.]GJE04924.1 Alanine racemase [Methylobacterium jeotgali]